MIVKQIDMETAFQLAAKGMEIKVLVPTDLENRWESMEPDTLQNMLADVLFFRQEPALEKQTLDELFNQEPESPPPVLMHPDMRMGMPKRKLVR